MINVLTTGGPCISRAVRNLNRPGSRDLVRVYPVKQVEGHFVPMRIS